MIPCQHAGNSAPYCANKPRWFPGEISFMFNPLLYPVSCIMVIIVFWLIFVNRCFTIITLQQPQHAECRLKNTKRDSKSEGQVRSCVYLNDSRVYLMCAHRVGNFSQIETLIMFIDSSTVIITWVLLESCVYFQASTSSMWHYVFLFHSMFCFENCPFIIMFFR